MSAPRRQHGDCHALVATVPGMWRCSQRECGIRARERRVGREARARRREAQSACVRGDGPCLCSLRPDGVCIAGYAESREHAILRQWAVDDRAPQKRASRPAYIPAHYIHGSLMIDDPRAEEGAERGDCESVGVGCETRPASRHYPSTEGKYGEALVRSRLPRPARLSKFRARTFLIDSPAEIHDGHYHHHNHDPTPQ
jgi:hypothetical protein